MLKDKNFTNQILKYIESHCLPLLFQILIVAAPIDVEFWLGWSSLSEQLILEVIHFSHVALEYFPNSNSHLFVKN